MEIELNLSIDNAAALDGPAVKIPLDYRNFIKLFNGPNSLENFVDGDTETRCDPDYSVFVDPSVITYEFKGLENVVLNRLRVYDTHDNFSPPVLVYAVDEYWQRVLIATIDGTAWNSWVTFNFDPVKARFLYIVGASSNIGWLADRLTEFEVYGTYTAAHGTVSIPDKPVFFNHLAGVCMYEWNVMVSDAPLTIDPAKLATISKLGLVRHYFDWNRVEVDEGDYTFQPERSGGWGLDNMYTALKNAGVFILTGFQKVPDWIANTYPEPAADVVQTPYLNRFDDPKSYLALARFCGNFCLRYGTNSILNLKGSVASEAELPSEGQEINDTWYITGTYSLQGTPTTYNAKAMTWTGDEWTEIASVDTAQPYAWEPRNQVLLNMGLVDMFEVGNEVNKTWSGRTHYLTGREHAAQMSICYDGHKGAFGPYVGIKNLVPSMPVSTMGTVDIATDYFRAMIDWSIQYRGYRPDGSVDVPFDCVNFHSYRTDAGGGQWGSATTGMSPEVSGYFEDMQGLRELIQRHCPQVELFLGESGYDWNQGSPHKAPPIGEKTTLEVAGDWILRMALESARAGVDYISFYQLYDDDPTGESGTQYATSGLADNDGSNREALAYLTQCRTFLSGFRYDGMLSLEPRVQRWVNGSTEVYAVWSPTQTGATGNYTLQVGQAPVSITRYNMNGTADSPTETGITPATEVSVAYSETPTFIKITRT